jgi:hypothetical protein
MTYYTKIHFLEDQNFSDSEDYDCKSILGSSYNYALTLIWKEEEVLFDEEKCEYSKCWYDFEKNDRFYEIFEDLWSKDISWWWDYYEIVKINFLWINKEEIDEFQEFFFWDLKRKTDFVWKFEDNRFLEIRKSFFEEIFNIEINLREVISFIFFNTYLNNTNLLRDIQVKLVVKLEKNQKIEDIIQDIENEFFYISFSEYKNLLNLTTLQDKEKTELLEISDSFEEWKNKIFIRWVQKEFYISFISSIKEDLDSIEKFRNSIMHNRWFSKNLKQNYDKSKIEIIKKIDNFKGQHMYLEWNDLDLIIWNEYEYIWNTTDNFIQWNKYKLLESFWWDTIFMWEKEKNPIPFFDKEFSLFWEWE